MYMVNFYNYAVCIHVFIVVVTSIHIHHIFVVDGFSLV